MFLVISSQKEPIKGWTDNFNGTNGLVVCMGLGYLRSLNTPDVVLDLVPVDKVANLIIVAAWKTAISRLKFIVYGICLKIH